MKSDTMKYLLLSACLALAALSAQAQVYRIVGPDGRVTFSDKPPASIDKASVLDKAESASSNGSQLPFELRQIASRYPVTLYTGDNCSPCDGGRGMLSTRGIPFTEFTVKTSQDAEALQKLSGENTLPFLTIGGQKIKGYSASEWGQFLDAAGYPPTSKLPTSYRRPAPAPLVKPPKPIPVEANSDNTAIPGAGAPPVSAPPAVNPANPAGIRF
jgi:glutaredoxin